MNKKNLIRSLNGMVVGIPLTVRFTKIEYDKFKMKYHIEMDVAVHNVEDNTDVVIMCTEFDVIDQALSQQSIKHLQDIIADTIRGDFAEIAIEKFLDKKPVE